MAAQHLGRASMSGFAWLTSSTLMVAIIRIVAMVIYVRLLSPEDFGTLAIAMMFVELANVLSGQGLARNIVQRRRISRRQIHTIFTSTLVSSCLVAILIVAASRPISSFFKAGDLTAVLSVVALNIPLVACSAVVLQLLQRQHDFKRAALYDASSYLSCTLLVGIPLAIAGVGVWSLIMAQLCYAALRCLLLLRSQAHQIGLGFSLPVYRGLMRRGGGYTIQRVANLIALKGDYLVVGNVLGPVLLGYYERAYVLMNISNQIIASNMASVLFPAFSRLNGDIQRQSRAFLQCMRIAALLFMPASAMMVVCAPEIVSVLLGHEWVTTVLPFQILASALFFRCAHKVSSSLIDANHYLRHSVLAQVIYAAAVVGGAMLTVSYGIVGVAASTTAAIGLVFLLNSYFACVSTGTPIYQLLRAMTPGVIATLGFTLIAALVMHEGRSHELPPIVTLSALGILVGVVGAAVALAAPQILGHELAVRLTKMRSAVYRALSRQ